MEAEQKCGEVGQQGNTSSPLLPPNYVSLKQLQELRLKEKRDQEEAAAAAAAEEEAAAEALRLKAAAEEDETEAKAKAKAKGKATAFWAKKREPMTQLPIAKAEKSTRESEAKRIETVAVDNKSVEEQKPCGVTVRKEFSKGAPVATWRPMKSVVEPEKEDSKMVMTGSHQKGKIRVKKGELVVAAESQKGKIRVEKGEEREVVAVAESQKDKITVEKGEEGEVVVVVAESQKVSGGGGGRRGKGNRIGRGFAGARRGGKGRVGGELQWVKKTID